MRSLLTLSVALVLLPAAPLAAQLQTPAATGIAKVENLADDQAFFDVEVAIVQWASSKEESKPDVPKPKLEGPREEVAARIAELQKAGQITGVQRVRLQMPEQRPGLVQIGLDQPRVTGAQLSPRGGTVNSIRYQSTGTLVEVVPRAMADSRIAVQLDLARSGIITPPEAPTFVESEAGGGLKADTTRTLTVRTIAVVNDGHTVVVSGSQQPDDGEIVLLSARKIAK
jgi:type II secretory pathway component HofQ